MSVIAYLSLGANLGERERALLEAVRRLGELGEVRKVSSFYETEPVEFTAQPWFLNCVVELETAKSAEELLAGLLAIERMMGRIRMQPKGPRTIDIDLLLCGDQRLDTPGVTVPHPAMHERRFVLAPLAEIAPDALHPVFMRSARDLLAALPEDSGAVHRVPSLHPGA